MITPEGKDRVGHGFVGQRHIGVRFQLVDHLIQGDGTLHPQVEPDTVHVLGIKLDGRGKQIQVAATRLEEMPGIARMVCAKDRKSTRLNSSHLVISYAVFCLKKKKKK